jgi:hypothetical protein
MSTLKGTELVKEDSWSGDAQWAERIRLRGQGVEVRKPPF